VVRLFLFLFGRDAVIFVAAFPVAVLATLFLLPRLLKADADQRNAAGLFSSPAEPIDW
jgi:hypothetical protein